MPPPPLYFYVASLGPALQFSDQGLPECHLTLANRVASCSLVTISPIRGCRSLHHIVVKSDPTVIRQFVTPELPGNNTLFRTNLIKGVLGVQTFVIITYDTIGRALIIKSTADVACAFDGV